MNKPPLGAVEFHYCEPPEGERYARRWWTDADLPWRVCMFCGQRQMKPDAPLPAPTAPSDGWQRPPHDGSSDSDGAAQS